MKALTGAARASGEAEEPRGVVTQATPSGLEIYFQAAPKRLYKLIREDEREVPAVSKVLDILEKPLAWWAQGIGIEGVRKLIGFNALTEGWWIHNETDEIVDLLTKNKLTVNHVRDQAGARGTAVHDALEVWAKTGILAAPNAFPEEERGYVRGLNDFLTDVQHSLEPIHSELMVASEFYGYAGRFDLQANFSSPTKVVTKTYPKRTPVKSTIEPGSFIIDLKTSKGVYPTHHLQLAAYKLAYTACGYGWVENTAVLHVTEDGRYEFVPGKAKARHFIAVKHAYDALQELK